uniref:Uncharacterized protein n=1 Tax=Corethron hystrix TaxID=216773 RepID=A0A7S1BI43_9STRA|mmetsp:Transcript_27998/g.64094  ORF Transcript_27998/g.64094 Transcript_27998/m.64094 type:complete len:278 (+) Transcript_27998:93-926(+)
MMPFSMSGGTAQKPLQPVIYFTILFCLIADVKGFSTTTEIRLRHLPQHAARLSWVVNDRYRPVSQSMAKMSGPNNDVEDDNPASEALKKTAWYATEVFGKVFGQRGKGGVIQSDGEKKDEIDDMTKPPSSLEETLRRIRSDVVERSYFLSGEVDKLIYTEDCVFADPFVSFSGRDRFVDNLSNLGSFITKYDAKLISYNTETTESANIVESDNVSVSTKIMVKLELNLPWKPVLAWPWGVSYTINPSNYLISEHIESWDIDALEGVKQVFRKPTVRI